MNLRTTGLCPIKMKKRINGITIVLRLPNLGGAEKSLEGVCGFMGH